MNTAIQSLSAVIHAHLAQHADASALTWLEGQRPAAPTEATEHSSDAAFTKAFALAARAFDKAPLADSAALAAAFDQAVPGWKPAAISPLRLARMYLLFHLPVGPQYLPTLHTLFTTASVEESVTLFQSLPGLAAPAQVLHYATEGLRSNISEAFQALALHNPYAAHYFGPALFTQLVLKAAFVGAPLFEIAGLRTHLNADLVAKLKDYVAERRAASRPVSNDILELVGASVEG